MKRVGIFTTFTSHDDAYSLCGVVADQIKMLLFAGIKPVVFVQESGWWKDEANFQKTSKGNVYRDVDIVQMPSVPCSNNVEIDKTFHEDVEKLYEFFVKNMGGIDVMLTHDLIYQPAALKHNVAARKYANFNSQIKWLHWIHSATSPQVLNAELEIFQDEYMVNVKQKFPNSKYVFFNHVSIERIANNFNIRMDDVVIVPHPTDFHELMGISDEIRLFAEVHNLLNKDFVAIYPARLDRGKQVEMMIRTMASLKRLGKKVAAIVVDFHSTGGDKVEYRKFLKEDGYKWGLTNEDLIFTSDTEGWRVGMPQEKLYQLMRYGNVFVMPCKSESYSLVLQEACMLGNIIVANDDFVPFRDIIGPHAIWRKYSANINRTTFLDGETTTNYDNEDAYHLETAQIIVGKANQSIEYQQKLRARKTRNIRHVSQEILMPLIQTL